jgi:fructuronate reductase
LSQVHAGVLTPAYDRASAQVGVVHFGPGAFHRAHQAFYFDQMLARRPGFGVCAVSLRSDAVRQALEPQDGLYALVEKAAQPRVRVIGALLEVATAPRDPAAVLRRLVDPRVRIVTATVTEKGYCLTPEGDLDLAHPDVRRDLGEAAPVSFVGWVLAGLRARRAAGTAPFTSLSCDNLSGNGARLKRAVLQLAQARGETELVGWMEAEARFPNTMVDSITPATDEALRTAAAEALGLQDAWPIQRERFVQWVVEDLPAAEADAFAEAGVTLTSDVAAFERAKLRILNGAHSTLAYVGLRMGHGTVAEAMSDARLAAFVERLMRQDAAASLTPAAGLDLTAYVGEVLARFRNPAIEHRLSQIAWDGSQKLPFRILETAAEALAAGRPLRRLAVPLAAWMLFVRQRARSGDDLVDPLANELLAVGRAAGESACADVAKFLGLSSVFRRELAAAEPFVAAVRDAYAALDADPYQALEA